MKALFTTAILVALAASPAAAQRFEKLPSTHVQNYDGLVNGSLASMPGENN